MMSYLVVIVSLLVFSPSAFSQSSLVLSENAIKSMIENSPPGVQQIESSFLSTKSQYMDKQERFGFRVDGAGQYFESDERTLSNFDGGVVKGSSSYTLGLTKPTQYGVNVGVKAFTGKNSNIFVADAATSGVSMTLAIDLFKNFLGRQTSSDLKKSQWGVQRAELEKQINLKVFESNSRQLYWALVANAEKAKLLSSLVDTSERQYKEALKRKRQGVADEGEVARYRSQWTSRKADLLSLGYQKSDFIRSLKELFPELKDKNIALNQYKTESIRSKVLACTVTIDSYIDAPVQFSHYDEVIDHLKKEAELEKRIARAHDDPSVQLTGEYSSVGRDIGHAAAQDNFSTDPRARRSVGIQVSIPIGSRSSDNREVKERLSKIRYQALAEQNLLKIKAYHEETKSQVRILKDVVKNQKDTNQSLNTSLKVNRLKYKQARISLQELISEEDQLLQSQLSEIDTNLAIISSLMNYFSVYQDFPCDLNRI